MYAFRQEERAPGMHISFSMKYYWIDLLMQPRECNKGWKEERRYRGREGGCWKWSGKKKKQKVRDMMKCPNKFAGKNETRERVKREGGKNHSNSWLWGIRAGEWKWYRREKSVYACVWMLYTLQADHYTRAASLTVTLIVWPSLLWCNLMYNGWWQWYNNVCICGCV